MKTWLTTSCGSGREGAPEFLEAAEAKAKAKREDSGKMGGTDWEETWVDFWRRVGTEFQESPAGRYARRHENTPPLMTWSADSPASY